MADVVVEILTPWHVVVEDGEPVRKPLAATCYRLRDWADLTAQDAAVLMLEPNLVAILVRADKAIVDAIRADDRFFVDNQNPVVTSAMLEWLARRKINLGLSGNEIGRDVRAYLRGLPKRG